jgi:hypothetical protein
MSGRIQMLDDLGAEFSRVATEVESRGQDVSQPRWQAFRPGARARTLAVAFAVTALFAGTAFAVPATREAVSSVAGSLTGWVLGDDGDAPGRAVEPGDNAPAWFGQNSGDARMIAESEGVGLFVRRSGPEGDRVLQFGLGSGMIVGDSLEGWSQRLGERPVVVLPGPAAFGPQDLLDDQGRFPLLGVTTRDVTRLEVQYAEGPPLVRENGDGGFVLLVDAWRLPRELVSYDRAGRVLEHTDLSGHDMRYLCEREPGCPPASGRP